MNTKLTPWLKTISSNLFITLFTFSLLNASPFAFSAHSHNNNGSTPHFNRTLLSISPSHISQKSSISALDSPQRGRLQDVPWSSEFISLDWQYQIGSEWGKTPVSLQSLPNESPWFQRAALATARTGGATGFVLGKFAQKIVMATNHHVFPLAFHCLGNSVHFPLLGVYARCSEFIGSWSEIDLALFIIEPRNLTDENLILKNAKNFSFHRSIDKKQPLLTIGFGVAGNHSRQLMANQDSDCVVFSETNEFKKLADPDQLNPGNYEAWSFANGCDVSHGDSGSAMVDRNNGDVLGIIWTGRIPKAARVQDSTYLQSLLHPEIGQSTEDIWQELSFAVPAAAIHNKLTELLMSNGKIKPEHISVLNALLLQ